MALQTRRFVVAGWAVTLFVAAIVSQECAGTAFAVFSCVVILISWALTRRSFDVFDLRRVTIGTFWYLTYLAMIFFPAFFVYADQEGPYRSAFLFAVESVLVTVPLGWILASKRNRFDQTETAAFFGRHIRPIDDLARHSLRFGLVATTCFGFLALYLWTAPVIPVRYLLSESGQSRGLALLREESFKLMNSPFTYAFYAVRGYLFSFAIVASLGTYLLTGRAKWLRTFVVTLAGGLCFASLTLAKSPVATLILTIGFFLYFYRSGAVSRKMVATFLILVFAFPVAIVLTAYAGQGFSTAELLLQNVGERVFYSPAEVLYYYFEVFPSHVGYLHGRSIGKLASLLGLPSFDTPNYVGVYGFPQYLDTINANGAFVGNLNADFGLLGVLFGGILAGYIMQSIHIYLARREKTILCLACYSLMVVVFWGLHSTALPVVLASDGALPLLLLLFLLERRVNRKRALPKIFADGLDAPQYGREVSS